MNSEKIQLLQNMIDSSERMVFFGGAGVSTESGIPDFRSSDGIYMMNYRYPPEQVVSHSFFREHPAEFFDFYKKHLIYPDAKPNPAHLKLAELEKAGKDITVVTQNIDGLHTEAGSKKVFELHGSVLRNFCMKCGREYGVESVTGCDGIPRCECSGIIKPDVVLFEESLDGDTITGAVNAISRADLLIVAGTSLAVYPAAGFIRYFSGSHLVLINRDETPFDSEFELIIRDNIGQVMNEIKA